MQWGVVVPVKSLSTAKTRLDAPTGGDRRDLALAFARDTVAAALMTQSIAVVAVVTNDPEVEEAFESVAVLVRDEPPGFGLNPALVRGAHIVHTLDASLGIAALCADLPAIRSADLRLALAHAATCNRAFVADVARTGTTLLTAVPGSDLDPRFGARSAAAHELSGATALEGPFTSLRQDVDDAADLAAALELGVGAWTSAALTIG